MSHFVRGNVVPSITSPIELCSKGATYRADKRTILASMNDGFNDIDVSWLKLASETYHISPDIKDFIVVPVPVVTADFPNRNLQAFVYTELTSFDPILGRTIYNTFRGKPTHANHQNDDPTKAKGVIFDSSIQYVPKYKVWKVIILTGWDRTKDTDLVKQIEKKKRTGHSMGALVNDFRCSICDAVVSSGNPCKHFTEKGKGGVISDELIFEKCSGVNFIESSSVEDPADTSAYGSDIWAMV